MEHLVLAQDAAGFVAESVVVGAVDEVAFAARYRIEGDAAWRTRAVQVEVVGTGRRIALASDGAGHWTDEGATIAPLDGALDVDLTITPFTNTLPIRRLALAAGEAAEILVVYVDVPALAITAARQRYTCLEAGRRYRFETLDGDFTRDVDVDAGGLVVSYPGLFRRVS